MRIGASLALIALGAILTFAVTDHINGVNLSTVGVILMVVGVLGLVISVVLMSARRRTDVIHQGGTGYVDANGAPVATSRTTYKQPSNYEPL